MQWRSNNCWFRYYPVHYCENCVLSKYTSSQFSLFSLKVNGIFYESWQVQSPSRVMSLCKTEVSKHPPPPQGQLLSKYSPVGVIGGGYLLGGSCTRGGVSSHKNRLLSSHQKNLLLLFIQRSSYLIRGGSFEEQNPFWKNQSISSEV